MGLPNLRDISSQEGVLEPTFLAQMSQALLTSDLLGENVLTGTFEGTQGFSFIFTDAGRQRLEQRLPQLIPFLEKVLGDRAVISLSPWWRRPLPLPKAHRCNAYYLNFLVVPPGQSVDPHVEGTLTLACDIPWRTPLCNSVLYLQAPRAGGGQLVVHGTKTKHRVLPKAGRLVHFRGDLVHEVLPIFAPRRGESEPDAAAMATDIESCRLSLVCEHYVVSAEEFSKVPAYRLDSRGYFARVMERLRQQRQGRQALAEPSAKPDST